MVLMTVKRALMEPIDETCRKCRWRKATKRGKYVDLTSHCEKCFMVGQKQPVQRASALWPVAPQQAGKWY